ncbi:acetoacetate-CoA ligase [Cryptococcus floricola]|uniref:Acetoacetate-CoA ligase n=1 Tax=Cryptococcus floricola TaxID=2591691 RepID=A0A5D3ARD8_9TREE|nr:acetoacetate-CoA ligase [Cryptococcus floricola]
MSQEPPLWSPPSPSTTQTAHFLRHINVAHGLALADYNDLWQWSCTHRSDFWSAVWDYEQVLGDKGGQGPYVDESRTPEDNPLWFQGAELNWAENQLRHAKTRPDAIAIIQVSESCDGYQAPTKRMTQRELYTLVGRAQRSLKKAGVSQGDRVGFWGGNCLEAVVTLLATSSLGAIFSSAAADFGTEGVVERLEQIQPKALVVTNGVVYGGTPRPLLAKVGPLLKALSKPPTQVVVVDHLPEEIASTPKALEGQVKRWDSWLDSEERDTEFLRIGFNEPIWILFSSGTTGAPKAIVHRQGGMLLDALREHHLAGDIGPSSVFFYYTTPGWMMFQYLISSLSTGSTIVLYEGSPLKPEGRLWDMVDELGVTVFGTSAKWLEYTERAYPDVGEKHDLGTLEQILSTGSPLPPSSYDFVYGKVKKDVLLGSVTGGTDVCSVFAGRNTSLPVYRGQIQSRMLGFALDTDAGPDQPGELICTQAFPIEPLGFWPLHGSGFSEDQVAAAKQRFQESYFKGDGGVWYHGDYVQITPSRDGNSGGLVMLGRSDGVLNPGGIRFGATDIYSVLETREYAEGEGVEECLVVGLMVSGGSDEKVVLFVKMKEGKTLSEGLVGKMKATIRSARSARHVPAKFLQVSDIPVTLTGKRIEVPIRKVINGAPLSSINPSTLRNPECLQEYFKLGERLRDEEGVGAGIYGL